MLALRSCLGCNSTYENSAANGPAKSVGVRVVQQSIYISIPRDFCLHMNMNIVSILGNPQVIAIEEMEIDTDVE